MNIGFLVVVATIEGSDVGDKGRTSKAQARLENEAADTLPIPRGPSEMKLGNSPAVLAAIIFVGLLLGYVYRWIFPPYVPVFSSFFISCLLFAHSPKRAQWVVHNLAFVFLALAITEMYFEFQKTDSSTTNSYVQLSTKQDGGLGWVARPGTFRVVKTYGFGTGVVYDVHYSIDKNGFRIAPDSLKQNGSLAMFFGDSLTFGAGVNDNETLPNVFSSLSGMRVLNFGIGGYGPHHMLRQLELDVPKKITTKFPRLMVYTAIQHHIARAAGRAIWDQHGPLYEIQNSHLRYVGSFQENNVVCNPYAIKRSIVERLLRHSRIWNAYTGWDTNFCSTSDANTLKHDRNRFVEIVKAANVIAHEKYNASFVVILWDVDNMQDMDWIETEMLNNKILTLNLSNAIKEADFRNWIIRRDGHPNPRAYREVAQVLFSWLKQNPTTVSSLRPFDLDKIPSR